MPHADELGIDSVSEVLTEFFQIPVKIRHDEAQFLCPVHDDNNPSTDCNLKSGYWSCFSCGASGDLIDLGIATLFDDGILFDKAINKKLLSKRMKQREEIKNLLIPNTPDAQLAATRRRLKSNLRKSEHIEKKASKRKMEIPPLGSYEDGPLDSLYVRGFTDEHLRKWNVRYVTSARLQREDGTEFEITHSVAIPIVEADGETMIGWCYRSTENSQEWQPRYLYTPGTILSEIWFGMDHAVAGVEVSVTEGALDAMWNDQHGYPCVAILGSNVKSARKLRQLTGFPKVCMFPDNDNAGLIWATNMGSFLQERGVGVTVVRLASWMMGRNGAPAKDANDLCSLDLELVRELAIPYRAWIKANF